MKGRVLKKETPRLSRNGLLDAGQDVRSAEKTKLYPGQSKLISTDLYISLPEGHVGLIWARSGLAVKYGIDVGAGCVDEGYRGEVKVLLRNNGDNLFIVEKDQRIAQLLTIPVNLEDYEEVDSLDETDRGDKGFGSSD